MSQYTTKKGLKIVAALMKQGYAEDEIESLFPNDKELVAFYEQSIKQNEVTAPEDTEEEPVDDFKLSPEESARLLADEARAETQDKHEKNKAAFAEGAATNPETGELLASYEDAMKAIEDLGDLSDIDLEDDDVAGA